MKYVPYLGSWLMLMLWTSLAVSQVELTEKEQRKLVSKAQDKLMQLQDLLNFISNETEVHDDVVQVIDVTFTEPDNPSRLFYNTSSIIESDLNPAKFDYTNFEDQYAREYLREFDLMYDKTTTPTVAFTNLQVSKILQKGYPYLWIKFDSRFTSYNRELPLPYRTTERIAEFRLEQVGNKWVPFISGIRFFDPSTPFKAANYEGKIAKVKAPKSPKVKQPKKTFTLTGNWRIPAGAGLMAVGGGIAALLLRPQPQPQSDIE